MLWSTLLAAIPIVVLLGAIGIFEIKAHIAALLGLARPPGRRLLFGMPAAWPA
jgi:lactate permease